MPSAVTTTSERFDPAADRFAIATLHGTSTLLRDFASLLDCARATASAADFFKAIEVGAIAGVIDSPALMFQNKTAIAAVIISQHPRAPVFARR